MATRVRSVATAERDSLTDLRERLADLRTRVRAAVELRRRGDPDPDDRDAGRRRR